MFRFGIPNYRPQWLHGRDQIADAHGPRLAGLVGLTLRHVWLVWDLSDDTWFADAPVLLDFGRDQVELDHQKFSDLSITWNTLDPSRAIEDGLFDLAWRAEPLPDLVDLPGRKLRRVELLEWFGAPDDMANGTVAVGFDLSPAWLIVLNALDENGLEHVPPRPGYRRHRITGDGPPAQSTASGTGGR